MVVGWLGTDHITDIVGRDRSLPRRGDHIVVTVSSCQPGSRQGNKEAAVTASQRSVALTVYDSMCIDFQGVPARVP